ncbi:hypothetical protein T11_17203 [Trichinella zimbabwensis]|uniref:Uncharacterized protein n=1 Tax=Trichinella zimbabwensis TaxID=268475 RepID=A0A0V1I1U8_9BILA|nr:hypothetical protein T11_17203 [Trichinella zimbabwensis]
MAYKTTDAMRRSYMCKEERRSIYDRRMTRNLRQWKRKAKWNKFSATKYFLCTSFQASGIGLNAFVVLRLYFLDVMDIVKKRFHLNLKIQISTITRKFGSAHRRGLSPWCSGKPYSGEQMYAVLRNLAGGARMEPLKLWHPDTSSCLPFKCARKETTTRRLFFDS